ncbi:uncharacterized protein [Eucyclogobius newberryi]|uniref:uncharacterized protein n=1 Tax=Eucyclogobius newberryi TaxID=166745 RepID=UPI003B5B604D
MSAGQTLRVLVNARLTAAAEEIFALFERTTAEFEEELRRSREENQRKQELLDSVLSQGLDQGLDHRGLKQGLHPGINRALNRGLNQEITRVKEELEDHLLIPESESSSACVKREESSWLQQSEHREEPQGEEPHLHPQTEGQPSDTDNDEDWRAPFSCSGAEMETEADGSSSALNKHRSEPETTSVTANTRDMTGTCERAAQMRHKCSICKKTFQSKDYLKVHARVHTGERPYRCAVCEKTFSQMSHLKSHTRTHTGDKPFSCSICGKTFSQTSHLKAHTRTHTGDRPFSCSVCGKSFVIGSTLKLHMRTHTGDRPFGCSLCGKTFSQRSHLKRHLKTHLTGQTLRVLVNARLTAAAEEIFALFERTTAEFEEELRRSREENQRKQELLDSVLNPRVALFRADHRTTESPGPGLDQGLDHEAPGIKHQEDPWSSSVCVKREESSLLQQSEHREEPQGEEPHLHPQTEGQPSDTDNDEDWRAPFSCSGAEVETEADGSSSALNKHRSEPETTSVTANTRDMTGTCERAAQTRHKCSICEKTLAQQSHLITHTRLHTGERPFICLVCGKGFVDATKLKLHNYTHTGERPFGCLICGKRFIVACRLKIHMKFHTGDRPFSCTVCEKTYVHRFKLKLHMRTHTGDRPFGCSACGKTFTQSFYLKKHMTTHKDKNLAAQKQKL